VQEPSAASQPESGTHQTHAISFSVFSTTAGQSLPLYNRGSFVAKPRIIAPEPIKGSVASAFSSTKEWVEVPERRANG
jgi:hypothetical protein